MLLGFSVLTTWLPQEVGLGPPSLPCEFLTGSAWNLFQNEKCHLLVEHETQKLKALDESHNQNLKEWRDRLRPRKKVTMLGRGLRRRLPGRQIQTRHTFRFILGN